MVISAILRDRVPEEIILFVISQPNFEWLISKEILNEYHQVLRRDKFKLPKEIIQRWDEIFATFTTLVGVDSNITFPRDQKDAKFLACAISSNAEYLITGDKDFSEAQKTKSTTIISASLFKKLICDTWS